MKKKIYFASDFHLGTSALQSSEEREKVIVRWLESIADDAHAIFFVGDIFDFWYEYKSVIPKGYSRFLAQLRRVVDLGIEVHLFTGNHDVWLFSYFTEEFGIPIHRAPISIKLQGKDMMIGHGDGLGPGDTGYKIIKKIFTNKACQWLWSRLHPNFALWLMKKTSHTSRKMSNDSDKFVLEREWLVQYAEKKQQSNSIDYYVFGHRHLPIEYTLSDGKGVYINLGDWLYHYSYGVMENGKLTLKYFEK